jgi:hypothetical protein
MVAWRAFMKKYHPDGDLADAGNVLGYGVANTICWVLNACGNDLPRENIMNPSRGHGSLRRKGSSR